MWKNNFQSELAIMRVCVTAKMRAGGARKQYPVFALTRNNFFFIENIFCYSSTLLSVWHLTAHARESIQQLQKNPLMKSLCEDLSGITYSRLALHLATPVNQHR